MRSHGTSSTHFPEMSGIEEPSNRMTTSLENLPNELLLNVIEYVYASGSTWSCLGEDCHDGPQPIHQLSLANQRFRTLCLPYAMRDIRVVTKNQQSTDWARERIKRLSQSEALLRHCR